MMTLIIVAAMMLMLSGAFVLHRDRHQQLARLRALVGISKIPTSAEKLISGAGAPADRILPPTLARNLRQLGFHMEMRHLAMAICGGILLFTAAAPLLGWPAAMALLAGIAVVAFAVLNILAGRRTLELGTYMPGFLDRVRQLLVVGNSLPVAFARATQGSSARLSAFFAPALRRIANGAGFSESIRQAADDADLYEMRLFSVAIATNMRFGGSLTHALKNLVESMRRRASIERELRASTSQIRASAIVLAVLPALVGGVIVFQNEDYARWFISDPAGKQMLVYCVCSQIIGLIVMRLVVRTRF